MWNVPLICRIHGVNEKTRVQWYRGVCLSQKLCKHWHWNKIFEHLLLPLVNFFGQTQMYGYLLFNHLWRFVGPEILFVFESLRPYSFARALISIGCVGFVFFFDNGRLKSITGMVKHHYPFFHVPRRLCFQTNERQWVSEVRYM